MPTKRALRKELVWLVVSCFSLEVIFLAISPPSLLALWMVRLETPWARIFTTRLYFNVLAHEWPGASSITTFNSSDLHIDTDQNGKFDLIIEGNIGPMSPSIEQNGQFVAAPGFTGSADLGNIARGQAIHDLTFLIWSSGLKIADIQHILVNLTQKDSFGASVHYQAQLVPTTEYDRSWTDYGDADLLKLVQRDITVVADTASGYEMGFHRRD